jgi:hypothetical protein
MSEYLNEMIGFQVEGTAEWRRQKAKQFPDARNLKAAEELERLAAEIDALSDSEIEKQISAAHHALNERNDDAWADINETVSAELRGLGFHSSYATATELLEFYRDLLHAKRDEQIETSMREQVEEDPAVRTAQAALEKAQADLKAAQDLAYVKLSRK